MELIRNICDEKKVASLVPTLSDEDKVAAMKFAICANLQNTVNVLMKNMNVGDELVQFAIDERNKRITDIHYDVLNVLINVVDKIYVVIDTNDKKMVSEYIEKYNYNCFDDEIKYCVDNNKINSLEAIIDSIGYEFEIEHIIYALKNNLNAYDVIVELCYPRRCECSTTEDLFADLEEAGCEQVLCNIAENRYYNVPTAAS